MLICRVEALVYPFLGLPYDFVLRLPLRLERHRRANYDVLKIAHVGKFDVGFCCPHGRIRVLKHSDED
jgi:hypothetical protein